MSKLKELKSFAANKDISRKSATGAPRRCPLTK